MKKYWRVVVRYRNKDGINRQINALVYAPSLQQAVNKTIRCCKEHRGGTRIQVIQVFQSMVDDIIVGFGKKDLHLENK